MRGEEGWASSDNNGTGGWEAFHVPLQQFICRRIADETTAEDVQEVFFKIHQHIETLS
jgi:DNA-directed RNA polymerase specialized sigma24 family protein